MTGSVNLFKHFFIFEVREKSPLVNLRNCILKRLTPPYFCDMCYFRKVGLHQIFLAPSELLKRRCRSVGRSDGRSVGWSVCVIQLFCSIQYMQRLFLAQYSLIQTSVDQFSLLQSNLVKSSHIQSNLVKSRQIFSRLFLAAYSACGGSLQYCLVWSRLVQTNLVYSSQIQSNLVISSQILSNLDKSFLGYFWQHIAHVVALYSLVQPRLDQ